MTHIATTNFIAKAEQKVFEPLFILPSWVEFERIRSLLHQFGPGLWSLSYLPALGLKTAKDHAAGHLIFAEVDKPFAFLAFKRLTVGSREDWPEPLCHDWSEWR